jgi:hypothetical protein
MRGPCRHGAARRRARRRVTRQLPFQGRDVRSYIIGERCATTEAVVRPATSLGARAITVEGLIKLDALQVWLEIPQTNEANVARLDVLPRQAYLDLVGSSSSAPSVCIPHDREGDLVAA